MRALVIAAIVLACAIARADPLVDALAADDPKAVAAAVTAIERAAADTPELADALFAAGRACEDTLLDPARALALYERIVRELPDARVALAAHRRAEALRAQIGERGEHAGPAADFAHLVAEADHLDPTLVLARGDALARADWPGAPEAALWVADWQRRAKQLADAQARYAAIATRWPGTESAVLAVRGGAGCALDAHDWDLAESLARALPATEPADRVVRDDLLDAAALGRSRRRFYTFAWLVVIAAFAALAGSLAESLLRGAGPRRFPRRPPFEVLFLAPVAAVLVGVALTTHELIAPAVFTVVAGGLGLAWLSGATLDILRARGRPFRRRALVHAAVALVGAAALLYIVLMRGDLFDMMIETVRFGPEP